MFTADTVVWEFIADTDKLDKAYKAEIRNSKKQGDKIGDSFEDGFDGETRGRDLMTGFTAGVKKGAPALKSALLAGTALATAGIGLTAGFAATARAAIASASDMQVLADVAGVSAERFQELRYAAGQYGVEQDKISDILKDVNDKFGDFNATGAGPLADFFENVAPKVGVLASDFRDLSSDQALGLYVDTLQKAGANQQDMAFYMEALAGDATMLLPLMRDNGKALEEFGSQARTAAGFLSNDAARAAQSADQKFNELGETLRGGLVKQVVELAPQIEELTQDVIDLVPTLLGWSESIVTGLSNIGTNLDTLSDKWNASPFGSGQADVDPENIAEVEDRLKSIIALNQTAEKVWEADGGFIDAVTRSRDEKDYWTLSVKIFGADAVEQMRKDGVDMRQIIQDEYNRTADLLKTMQTPSPSVVTPSDADNEGSVSTGSFGSGIDGGGAARIAEEEKAKAKAEAEAIKETQRRIAEAQKMRDDNLTAEEQYQADLADIREVAADPMLLEIAGGEETIMRARIDALVDLAQASDDVGAAHIALTTAIEQGTLTENAALEAATRLNTEFGIFTKAQIEAREALEKKNDELIAQIEYQRVLAEASGDFTEVTRLTRELEVLRQKGDLLRENLALTEQEAQVRAQADVDKLSKAQDLSGFDDLQSETNDNAGGLENELARIDEIETAKLELLESYRTKETEALRDFEALKTQIETEAEQERREIKLAALDDQLAMAEGVFGGISDLLKAAGAEDSKAAQAAAKAEKVIAIGRATVNTAVGVSRALAEQPFPLNFITAGLVGAAGAVQIATIASSFKDGVVSLDGPGTERSDDIPAMLSKGESVITARATRGNEQGLERLNAGMSPRAAFGISENIGAYKDGVVSLRGGDARQNYAISAAEGTLNTREVNGTKPVEKVTGGKPRIPYLTPHIKENLRHEILDKIEKGPNVELGNQTRDLNLVSLIGPGTERSDDIPAMLSKGESVLTARATRGNELGLERLNAGMSPEEAFGLGRVRRGYKDGVIAVGAPMSRVPDIAPPDTSVFNTMATNAPTSSVTNHFDIKGIDTEKALAYADQKSKETEARVPGIMSASDTRSKRARPR